MRAAAAQQADDKQHEDDDQQSMDDRAPIINVPTIPSSQAINRAPTESSMAPIVSACLCV